MSAMLSPARRRAFAVAGIGAVSMTTGSSPVTTAVRIRASGVSPCAAAQSADVIASAAAPSEICDAEPAVTTPSARNGVFSSPSFSSVESRRTPSSCLTESTGTISASNAPASCAAAALAWLSSAYQSSCRRDRPHRAAIISAPTPWLNGTVAPSSNPSTPAYRACTSGPNGRPGPEPPAAPMGTRVIDSTPPATTRSACPDTTAAAATCTACWLDPHCRSTVVAGTVSGQPAASTALRPTFHACSPTWETQPQTTSSTSAGSKPARSASARSTCADRSTGWMPARPPPRRPTGVRTAATITASGMVTPR